MRLLWSNSLSSNSVGFSELGLSVYWFTGRDKGQALEVLCLLLTQFGSYMNSGSMGQKKKKHEVEKEYDLVFLVTVFSLKVGESYRPH